LTLRLKRAYEPPSTADGKRYLVDRLWPRGVGRAALALDGWLKEVAPSDALRRWYGHEVSRFPEFRRRYRIELEAHRPLLENLGREASQGAVTLVFATRDEEHSNAAVLRELAEEVGRV